MDKNLFQRLITGSLFVIVLVSAICFSVWSMVGIFLLITILGLREFYKLANKAGAHPQKIFGTILGALILLAAFFFKACPTRLIILLLPLSFLPFFIELYRKKHNPFANIAWTILGLFYIAIPFSLLILKFVPFHFLMPHLPGEVPGPNVYNFRPLLSIFVLIWISDSMAYVFGRLFGKHKLFERISPKKTWEGFIGGLIFTAAAGAAFGHWLLFDITNSPLEITWTCVAIVISISGMLGDLTESLLKRSIDIKDSGKLLPGHGGILDRFDALLLATPFAIFTYWICEYISSSFPL